MAFGSISVDKITDSEGSVFSPTSALFRNRIINGDMRIDQRNAGAAVTVSTSYPVDRFRVVNSTDGSFSAQQDSSAPAGFVNSVKITTTTADATLTTTQNLHFRQDIEGTNIADFAWGTANAKTITISFWVRSSLTGTFGGTLRNNGGARSYPFTYSISSADTWEQKSVTIAGDTSGTWLTTTGVGIICAFALGAGPDVSGTAGAWVGANYISATGTTSVIGTLNATWYITGVQLEVGSVATPFERRPYGTELALCQRYYENSFAAGIAVANNVGAVAFGGANSINGSNVRSSGIFFKVPKRTTPTVTPFSPSISGSSAGLWMLYNNAWGNTTATGVADVSSNYFHMSMDSTTTQNSAYLVSGNWTASAEL